MSRLSRVFAPKEQQFFSLFEAAGANILAAATLLDDMLRDYPERADLANEIAAREHEGDRITREVMLRVNRTSATPIDREDIHELASALDQILDLIEEVAAYLGLYRIEAPMEQSQRLAHILMLSTRQISEAMPRLRGFKDISRHTTEIRRLDHEGDDICRAAMGALFDTGIDPMVVIRWKDGGRRDHHRGHRHQERLMARSPRSGHPR
jgi:hypothetical protein